MLLPRSLMASEVAGVLAARLRKACMADDEGEFVSDEVGHFDHELQEVRQTIEATLRGTQRWTDSSSLAASGKSPSVVHSFPETLLMDSLQESLAVRVDNDAEARKALAETLRKAFVWLWKCAFNILLDPGRPETRRILVRIANPKQYCIHVWPLCSK